MGRRIASTKARTAPGVSACVSSTPCTPVASTCANIHAFARTVASSVPLTGTLTMTVGMRWPLLVGPPRREPLHILGEAFDVVWRVFHVVADVVGIDLSIFLPLLKAALRTGMRTGVIDRLALREQFDCSIDSFCLRCLSQSRRETQTSENQEHRCPDEKLSHGFLRRLCRKVGSSIATKGTKTGMKNGVRPLSRSVTSLITYTPFRGKGLTPFFTPVLCLLWLIPICDR